MSHPNHGIFLRFSRLHSLHLDNFKLHSILIYAVYKVNIWNKSASSARVLHRAFSLLRKTSPIPLKNSICDAGCASVPDAYWCVSITKKLGQSLSFIIMDDGVCFSPSKNNSKINVACTTVFTIVMTRSRYVKLR